MTKSTRREFIRRVGVALGALLAVRCGRTTCYEVAPITPGGTAVPSSGALWAELRACWLDLDSPELRSFEDNDFIRDLRQRHADTLAALVDSGELDQAVVDEIAAAFEEAIAHVQRQQATCYIALPPEFIPRQDLMQQADLLTEMEAEGDIDPGTVAQVQTALERDIAWLTKFHAGESPEEWEGIEITPDAAEAARILIALLLGRQGFVE